MPAPETLSPSPIVKKEIGSKWCTNGFRKKHLQILENTPKKYRNEFGQHLEHSPYCERDMKFTDFKEPIDEKGEHKLIVRTYQGFQEYLI